MAFVCLCVLKHVCVCMCVQGTDMDMFSGVADHWPNLPSLTSRLHALVCLDLSACLMQDSHLQVCAHAYHYSAFAKKHMLTRPSAHVMRVSL